MRSSFLIVLCAALAAAAPTRFEKRAVDTGSCGDPSIQFAAGLGGRQEPTFQAVNLKDFNQGSALNINIIANFICTRFQSPCNAPQESIDACKAATAAAQGKTGQAAADAFNDVLAAGTAAGGNNGNNGNGNNGNGNNGNGNNGNGNNGNGNNGNGNNGNGNGNNGNGNGNNGNGNGNNGNGNGNGNNGNNNGNNGNANNGGCNGNNNNNGGNAGGNNGNAGGNNGNAGGNNGNTGGNNGNAGGNNGGNAGGNNGGNAGGNNGGNAGGVGALNLDLGICTDPTMDFQPGVNGRKATEFTFLPTNSDGNFGGQQEALNPNIIANFICDTFTNRCKASDAAKAACQNAKAIVAAAGVRDQSVADAFNAALGF